MTKLIIEKYSLRFLLFTLITINLTYGFTIKYESSSEKMATSMNAVELRQQAVHQAKNTKIPMDYVIAGGSAVGLVVFVAFVGFRLRRCRGRPDLTSYLIEEQKFDPKIDGKQVEIEVNKSKKKIPRSQSSNRIDIVAEEEKKEKSKRNTL